MNAVTLTSAFPTTVQPGIPKLGEKPEGWIRAPLGRFLREVRRPIKMADEARYRLVTVKRARGGVVERDRLLGKEISVKSQFLLEPGDFLISKRQIVHGACGLVPEDLAGSIVSNEYAVLDGTNEIDLRFLNYLAHSVFFQQTCFHSSIGVHVEKMIFKLDRWLRWEFDLPPLPEQRKIADILATWDQAIETTEALLATARTQKRALMQSLLTGKRRFPEFEGQPWKKVRFGDVVQLSKERLDPRQDHNARTCIELEHIESETGRLLGSTTSDQQASIKAVFGPGEVLFGKLRPYLRKFVAPDFDGVCSTEIWVLQPNAKRISAPFLHCVVQSDGFMAEADKSSGSKMPRADWKVVSDYSFRLPEPAEQDRIAEVLASCDTEIDGHADQIDKLRTEKKALMQQLLTGKRRVVV